MWRSIRCGQIGRAAAARTSDAVIIDDKEAVGDRVVMRKLVEEIMVVIPADAAVPADHQPGAAQDEAAGAHADQLHAHARGRFQIFDRLVVDLAPAMQDAADHDDIVEMLGVLEAAGARDGDAAAGAGRLRPRRHDRPAAQDLAAAVALVGREAELVDEEREGRKREIIGQDETDRERRTHRRLLILGQSLHRLQNLHVPVSPNQWKGPN